MQYKYIYDDSPIQAGDVVEFNHPMPYNEQYKNGRVYLVKSIQGGHLQTELDDKDSPTNGISARNFRKIKAFIGTKHVKGDLVIYIGDRGTARGTAIIGHAYRSKQNNPDHIHWHPTEGFSRDADEFLVVDTVNNINNRDKSAWSTL